ncbi:hypothetical protein [Hwanghaeella sp.]|uniref:hypothetical protein n=1 Tax=Hwanghaeella sp. TaxID=2605943 RepID=UPI003CCBC303
MNLPTGKPAIRNTTVAALLSLIAILPFTASTAFAVPMWKEAKRWQCIQDEFEAACGGRYDKQCRTQEPRKLQNLLFDFDENMVIIDDGLGISYIPITARTVDRRREISTILYGEAGNIVMQYSGGQAVSMSMPAGGGAASLQFFACEPAPAE